MARTAGARNRDYGHTRDALAARMADRVAVRSGHGAPTLAELAAAARVSPPTLRHYFGDLDGALAAALEATGRGADRHLAAAADPGSTDVTSSVHDLVRLTVRSWREHGVGAVMAAGMSLGLSHPALGPVHLTEQLDPVIDAAARRLGVHIGRGELPAMDTRIAALGLLAPVLVALLHQEHLGGRGASPLDVDAFADRHTDVMLAGWLASGASTRGTAVGSAQRNRSARTTGTPRTSGGVSRDRGSTEV
jgi:AcrR family transcriptional regulator